MNHSKSLHRSFVILALSCAIAVPVLLIAQPASRIYTVKEAKDDARGLGATRLLVRGHLWCGKEGSMIFDDGYKAVLKLRYSVEFNSKHSYQDLLGKARKSDVATITGLIRRDSDGTIVLVAEDIQFASKPH
jgi:hypothetical protein